MKNSFLIFSLFVSTALIAFGQSKTKSLKNDQSQAIKKIETTFNNYVKYGESTDSEENKKTMTKSLNSLTRVTRQADLELLVNVWMYYDPTDYPSRDLVFKILKQNKEESLTAIKNRIINKKDWEENDEAPYGELEYLFKKVGEK